MTSWQGAFSMIFGAMGLAMAVHLGFILAFFLVLPYSKMVHAVYRSAALLRSAGADVAQF